MWQRKGSSGPNSNGVLISDPQMPFQGLGGKGGEEPSNQSQDGVPVLQARTQDDNAEMVLRRIKADVCKVEVERDQAAMFVATNLGDQRVAVSAHPLIEDRQGIVPRVNEQLSGFDRKVLVHLETHHATFGGSGTMRSRASS